MTEDTNNEIEINNSEEEKMQEYLIVPCDGVLLPRGELRVIAKAEVAEQLMSAAEAKKALLFVYAENSSPYIRSLLDIKGITSLGTLGKISQALRIEDDKIALLVSGEEDMRIVNVRTDDNCVYALAEERIEKPTSDAELTVLLNMLNEFIEEYNKAFHMKRLTRIEKTDNPDEVIANKARELILTVDDHKKIFELDGFGAKLRYIGQYINEKVELNKVSSEIEEKLRKEMNTRSREYYLRRQMDAIQNELGDDVSEVDEYADKFSGKVLPEYVKNKVNKELRKLAKTQPSSPEAGISRSYLDLIAELPWSKAKNKSIQIEKAEEILNRDHYGLEKVKERILEHLAVQKLKKNMNCPVLCFVGPPGVGKTSVARSIAEAVGRKFITISLGGVRDEAEIRGHRRTYIGAMPGRIIDALRDCGSTNPLILLDEIDKMTSDFRGDPASALLEVLDVNQNKTFKDHYLDMPYDLSKVMFIATANTLDTISAPLLDRMEIIEISGYTYNEKLNIAKKYLVPKQCAENGVEPDTLEITDEALLDIIQKYTRESGVRNLEREIGAVIRKVAYFIVKNSKQETFKIDADNLKDYLGTPKFTEDETTTEDQEGVVTGLAWTSVGGTTLNIEVEKLGGGKGDIKLTGNLGDVMKESAQTALSVIRNRADSLGIDASAFNDNDIHLHVPAGATPKDGPSAGISIATAIASALSGKKVSGKVAMTGEITLKGKVLAIGGLKEKALAALRANKKVLIIPEENTKDIAEIPTEVKEYMEIRTVNNIDEVFSLALK